MHGHLGDGNEQGDERRQAGGGDGLGASLARRPAGGLLPHLPQGGGRLVWACWFFILAVTFLDVAFAVANADTFETWEANRLAVAVGVGPAVAWRLASVAFGMACVLSAPGRTRRLGTAAVSAAHLYLLGLYALALGAA